MARTHWNVMPCIYNRGDCGQPPPILESFQRFRHIHAVMHVTLFTKLPLLVIVML